jgi:pro-kumamolisin-like protein/Big-like domain-containing protein
MNTLWRSFALAMALVLAVPLVAAAQGSAASTVRPRVTDRVDLTRLVTLKGNTHALARVQYDQGTAPANLPMNRIMLVLQRSPEQEAALQDLLSQQQINSSGSFHRWLTPDQFGQQFGPADADVQAVTSWLASFGFQNIQVSRGRVTIEFSGTASQVQAALHTPIHRYVVNGESHWANANDPQIPAALAPVISGFASLHNFGHRPTIKTSDKRYPVKIAPTPGAQPQIDLGNNGTTHALVPADFNTIYNVAPTMTGAGETIAIVSDSNINVSDVTEFRNMFGLASTNNPPTIVPDGPLPDVVPGGAGEGEAVLDATWSGAVAPLATVKLVVSEDTDASAGTDLSEAFIIDNNLADVMTESFSACEGFFAANGELLGSNGAAAFYSLMAEQAAAQGITYLVSSGDGGPDTCDDQTTIPTTDQPASVNLLAATPFNVAVGGTMFNDISNPGTYWSSTNNATTSGSALSYIPEDVWNESCTVVSSTCPVIGLWSSGGGQSVAFPKPVWQAGVTGIPVANARFLPDVSLAAADHDGYVICVDGSCDGTGSGCPTGVAVCFGIASGTSASVQAMGGIMALVDQKMGGRQGQADYALYKLAAAETLSSCNGSNLLPALPPANTCIFNDVTSGNTNIPGEMGFTAGTGYDQATGLGSVNVTNLVNQWHTAVSEGTTTSLDLNNNQAVNVTHGTAVSVLVTVSPAPPSTGSPTGDVSLVATNTGSGQGADFFPLTQNGTSSSAAWNTSFLPGGSYTVKAHYSGDGTFLGSDSPTVSVRVNPEASATLIGLINESSGTFCLTTNSVTYGSLYILTVAVIDSLGAGPVCAPTPSGAFPSGSVSVTDNGTALDGGTFNLNGNGYFEDQKIQLTAGNHTIQATYQGDNSFSAGTPVSISVAVAKASTVSIITNHPATVSANAPFQLTAFIDSQTSLTNPGSTGTAPTGTITFFVTTTGAVFKPGDRHRPGPSPLIVAETLLAMICLYLFLVVGKQRRGTALLIATIATVIAVGTSCGSSGNGGGGGGGGGTLGTVNVSGTTDINGFAAATATLTNVTLSTTSTITATYNGDGNYNASSAGGVTVTVQ